MNEYLYLYNIYINTILYIESSKIDFFIYNNFL